MGDLSGDGPDDLEGLDASAAHVANLLSTEPANSMFFILSSLLKSVNNSNVRRVYMLLDQVYHQNRVLTVHVIFLTILKEKETPQFTFFCGCCDESTS